MNMLLKTSLSLVVCLMTILTSCALQESTYSTDKTGKPNKELSTAAENTSSITVTPPPETVPVFYETEPPIMTAGTTYVPTEPISTLPSMDSLIPADGHLFSTNIENTAALSELDALFSAFRDMNVSVYYEDLLTGDYFAFNPEEEYCFQSVTKAFYVDYMYHTMTEDELSGTLPMTDAARLFAYYGGVADEPTGKELDISYLINKAITVSDVASYNLLYDAFGVDGFNEYAEMNGSGLRLNTVYQMGRFSYGNVLDAAALLKGM